MRCEEASKVSISPSGHGYGHGYGVTSRRQVFVHFEDTVGGRLDTPLTLDNCPWHFFSTSTLRPASSTMVATTTILAIVMMPFCILAAEWGLFRPLKFTILVHPHSDVNCGTNVLPSSQQVVAKNFACQSFDSADMFTSAMAKDFKSFFYRFKYGHTFGPFFDDKFRECNISAYAGRYCNGHRHTWVALRRFDCLDVGNQTFESLRLDCPDRMAQSSISLLRSLKKSASHNSGFSGSYAARNFMPSSKWGVMFWLRYCRVGPPCATGLSGLADGCGGIEPGRAGFPDAVGEVGALSEGAGKDISLGRNREDQMFQLTSIPGSSFISTSVPLRVASVISTTNPQVCEVENSNAKSTQALLWERRKSAMAANGHDLCDQIRHEFRVRLHPFKAPASKAPTKVVKQPNSSPSPSPSKQRPTRPKVVKTDLSQLAAAENQSLPVDVHYATNTLAASLEKSGLYTHSITLKAAASFKLVDTALITEGKHAGRQAILLEPAKPFRFMLLTRDIRVLVYRFYLAQNGTVDEAIVFDGKRANKEPYAKTFAQGSKNRVGLLASCQELAEWIAQVNQPVRLLLRSVEVVAYTKTSSRMAFHLLTEARFLTRLHIDSGISTENDPIKAAKAFYSDAYKLLEAIGSTNRMLDQANTNSSGNAGGAKEVNKKPNDADEANDEVIITDGIDILSFGRNAFVTKDSGTRKVTPWNRALVDEFKESLRAKMKSSKLTAWVCVCGVLVPGHHCSTELSARQKTKHARQEVLHLRHGGNDMLAALS
nr:hypothetical protein CFP56_50408 [Quercus suber]